MRFIHTADWHIGRQFHNVSLLEDQVHALEQVVEIVRETGAEALVIAGDLYDRAVPPADAVRLLGETLERVVLGLRVPVIAIAGNHDSPERIGFASHLLAGRGLHLFGPLANPLPVVTLADGDGPVRFHPLPYTEPALVRERFGAAGVHGHDAAMGALVASLALRPGERAVAVAHCFVTGGEGSESERPLTVGGAEHVAANRFTPFRYAALGHLHRPQRVGEHIHYAGSLLKYSFSEAGHRKSVTLVELDAAGACRAERIPLSPRRDLRILEGRLAALLEGPAAGENRDDYLLVRLTDRHAILDAMGRLREIYPNVLHLERPGLFHDGEIRRPGREQLRRSEETLFASFFEQATGEALRAEEAAAFAEVLEAVRAGAREAGQ